MGIVLGAVVIITCLFGFYQEYKANEAMDSFKNYIPSTCKVYREARIIEIPTEEIVVGDIVCIENGMRVPADMRIIECNSLYVDNSCLTGEALELERLTD